VNVPQLITKLLARVSLLESRVNPVITSTGKLSTAALTGVLPAHTHGGVGQGGSSLQPIAFKLTAVAADPAYSDGYAIIYFYSTGGVDELRVRGKIGAVETQAVLANLSP
jgi:hypothetical protein